MMLNGWIICRAYGTYTKYAAEYFEFGKLTGLVDNRQQLIAPRIEFNPALGWSQRVREPQAEFSDREAAEEALASYLLVHGG